MNFRAIEKHRSWFYSAGMAVLITLWLLSGAIGNDSRDDIAVHATNVPGESPRSKVRVRTQSAETITRTIVVNGKTAPARVVELGAETDGRVEHVGAERGANVTRGGLSVRLDMLDRAARLAQAQATVKQR